MEISYTINACYSDITSGNTKHFISAKLFPTNGSGFLCASHTADTTTTSLKILTIKIPTCYAIVCIGYGYNDSVDIIIHTYIRKDTNIRYKSSLNSIYPSMYNDISR